MMSSTDMAPYLSLRDQLKLCIALPPLSRQRASAALLGALDDKIDLNRKMSATLESVALALFKSWFVDFDPVLAKSEGGDPGLPIEIAAIFPDSFEESELGRIPKGWSAAPLSEILEESIERIGNQAAPEYSSTNEGLQLRSVRFKKTLSRSATRNKLIRRGYFVFGLSRKVLNFGIMRDELGSVSPAYKVFRVVNPSVPPAMLERLMRASPSYYYRAISASSREGQAVSTQALGVLKIVQPPQAIQDWFFSIEMALAQRMKAAERESHTLSSIRNALLPKLISCEICEADAERVVERST